MEPPEMAPDRQEMTQNATSTTASRSVSPEPTRETNDTDNTDRILNSPSAMDVLERRHFRPFTYEQEDKLFMWFALAILFHVYFLWTGDPHATVWFTIWFLRFTMLLLTSIMFWPVVACAVLALGSYAISLGIFFVSAAIGAIGTVIVMPWWMVQFEIWRCDYLQLHSRQWVEAWGCSSWILGETLTSWLLCVLKLPWAPRFAWGDIEIWLTSLAFPTGDTKKILFFEYFDLKAPIFSRLAWYLAWAFVVLNVVEQADKVLLGGLTFIRPTFMSIVNREEYDELDERGRLVVAPQHLMVPVHALQTAASGRAFGMAVFATLSMSIYEGALTSKLVFGFLLQWGLIFIREFYQMPSYISSTSGRHVAHPDEDPNLEGPDGLLFPRRWLRFVFDRLQGWIPDWFGGNPVVQRLLAPNDSILSKVLRRMKVVIPFWLRIVDHSEHGGEN